MKTKPTQIIIMITTLALSIIIFAKFSIGTNPTPIKRSSSIKESRIVEADSPKEVIKNAIHNKSNKSTEFEIALAHYLEQYAIGGTDNGVDQEGIDWSDIHRQWASKVENYYLYNSSNQTTAKRKTLQYLKFMTSFGQDSEYKRIMGKHIKLGKKYLESSAIDNMTNTEKSKRKRLYLKSKKLLKQFNLKREKKVRDFLGKDFEAIQSLLKEFNKEISEKNAHLGHQIGISFY